ncbi:hypothetical protein NL676_011662 [Syzygium grande]|nr:hypothetical protein NL676_011662 [Syzygium grande]
MISGRFSFDCPAMEVEDPAGRKKKLASHGGLRLQRSGKTEEACGGASKYSSHLQALYYFMGSDKADWRSSSDS